MWTVTTADAATIGSGSRIGAVIGREWPVSTTTAVAGATGTTYELTQDDVVYFIVTDRFYGRDKRTPAYEDAIATLSREREHLVFILWGSYAIAKKALIDTNRHHVITSPHPSPLMCRRSCTATSSTPPTSAASTSRWRRSGGAGRRAS